MMRASDTQKTPYGNEEVNGRQLHGNDLKEYRQRRGYCEICGLFPTHEAEGKRKFLGKNKYKIPITALNDDGSYKVYKGFCIQPRCYTLLEAKKILGELTTTPVEGTRKKKHRLPPGAQKLENSLLLPPPEAETSAHNRTSQSSLEPSLGSLSQDSNWQRLSEGLDASGRGNERSSNTFHQSVPQSATWESLSEDRDLYDSYHGGGRTLAQIGNPPNPTAQGRAWEGSSGEFRRSLPTTKGEKIHREPPPSQSPRTHRKIRPFSQSLPTTNGETIHLVPPPSQSPRTPRHVRPNNELHILDETLALTGRRNTRRFKPSSDQLFQAPAAQLPFESSDATTSSSANSDHSPLLYQEQARLESNGSKPLRQTVKSEPTVPYVQSQSKLSDHFTTHRIADNRVAPNGQSVPDHTASQSRIAGHASSNEVATQQAHAAATDKLDDAAQVGDYIRFLTILESNATKSEVVIYGLSLLRTIVNRAHKERASTVVFISDTWVKSLKCIMNDNQANPTIQEEGVFTMWVLSAISNRYMLDIVKYGGVKHVVSLLENNRGHFGIGEKCCGTLEIFTARESGGLILQSNDVEAIIRALTNALASPNAGGKDSALRALLNLSQNGQPRSGIPIEQLIQDAIPGSRGINAIIEAACDPLLAESAIWLLWTMSAPVGKPCIVPPSAEIISAINAAVTKSAEPSLQEAAHGLLANLVAQRGFPLALVPALTDCAIGSMQSLWQPPVALEMGCLHVLCNILYDSDRRKGLDLDRMISCVTDVMDASSLSLETQAMGCLALAYISSTSEELKVSIATKGGIMSVARAFRSSADNALDSPKNTQLKFELRSNACIALTSLALSPQVMKLMEQSGILTELAETVRGSDAASLSLIVEEGFMNLVHTSLTEDESMTSTVALEVVMNIDAGEEEIESSIKKLFTLCVKSPSTLNCVMAARGGTGVAMISELIKKFVSSVDIRLSGCGLLAEIYAHVPFQGYLGQISSIEVGSSACNVTTHSGIEVEALRDCLRVQKTEENVLGNAAVALSNFLCGLSSLHEGPLSDEIRALFSGTLHELVGAMACHEDNMELQTNCIRCVRVVLFSVEYSELKRCGGFIARRIVFAMNEFPEGDELQLNACIALLALADENDQDDSISILGQRDGIKALLACFDNAKEEVVDFATELLATSVGRFLTAVSIIVNVQDSFKCIITCMCRYQSSTRIQAHCCFILWSLASLHDCYVLPIIAHSGGVIAILEAMTRNDGDEMIQEYGCKALSAVLARLDTETFSNLEQALADNTLRVLDSHIEIAKIATPALEMVAMLCGKDPFFKNFFSRSNCIPLVIAAMNQHLADQFVELGGISALWSLASFGDNKHTIGDYGGLHAIINALLAHIDVKQIQVDGLTVLKNLATTATNKQIIARQGGEEAIVCSLWVNMDSAKVLAAAFAALNNIAVDTESRRVSTASNDTLTCILLGMRRFRHSEAVQENACFLLKSYTYSPSNLTLMRNRNTEFRRELTMAADSFPSTCGKRAEYILSKFEF